MEQHDIIVLEENPSVDRQMGRSRKLNIRVVQNIQFIDCQMSQLTFLWNDYFTNKKVCIIRRHLMISYRDR